MGGSIVRSDRPATGRVEILFFDGFLGPLLLVTFLVIRGLFVNHASEEVVKRGMSHIWLFDGLSVYEFMTSGG